MLTKLAAVRPELKGYSDLDAALGTTGGFEGTVQDRSSYAFYGGVIALSVLFQGGNALYYFTRRRHVEDFIAETPEWVRDVQRGRYRLVRRTLRSGCSSRARS